MSAKFMRIQLVFLSVVLLVASVSQAEEPKEELEKQAAQIEGLLIAPCCWRQPVSDHYSPAADEVRSEIRNMLAAGSTKEEILDRYIGEYGEKILAKPPAHGFSLLAYFLPLVFLITGAALALAVIKKLRSPRQPESRKAPRKSRVDPRYAEQIEKELWE
jgi:cytochrome c-type biogenesis protein CcmH